MAQATFKDSMNRESGPSVAFIITRNGDPLTLALRNGEQVDDDELVQLNQASTPMSASVGSSSTADFSSREPSIITKPTSYGTNYPAHDYSCGDKMDAAYPSSLSATHGSESEAEVEHEDAHSHSLLGAGAWTSSYQAEPPCLRGDMRAKLSTKLPNRKKYPVVLHQHERTGVPTLQDGESNLTATSPQAKLVQRCPRHLIPQQHYTLLWLVILLALTISLGGGCVYFFFKMGTLLIKSIVFVTTILTFVETVVIMLVAKQAFSEALHTGLFPLTIGFMLLSHVEDFV